jgi:hypothetical protein
VIGKSRNKLAALLGGLLMVFIFGQSSPPKQVVEGPAPTSAPICRKSENLGKCCESSNQGGGQCGGQACYATVITCGNSYNCVTSSGAGAMQCCAQGWCQKTTTHYECKDGWCSIVGEPEHTNIVQSYSACGDACGNPQQ